MKILRITSRDSKLYRDGGKFFCFLSFRFKGPISLRVYGHSSQPDLSANPSFLNGYPHGAIAICDLNGIGDVLKHFNKFIFNFRSWIGRGVAILEL